MHSILRKRKTVHTDSSNASRLAMFFDISNFHWNPGINTECSKNGNIVQFTYNPTYQNSEEYIHYTQNILGNMA